MVEPISLAAVSAISGLILGKISKRDSTPEKEEIEDTDVEFISVEDGIDPKDLLPYLQNGKSSFLNTNKVKNLSELLEALHQFATENEFKVNRVSNDLLIITPAEHKIKIRQLVRKEKLPRKLDIEINGS